MAVEVLLPKIGFTMVEGVIAEWQVQDGSEVTEGQVLYVLEADKATQEIEAPASGVINIIRQAGEDIEVGTVVAIIK